MSVEQMSFGQTTCKAPSELFVVKICFNFFRMKRWNAVGLRLLKLFCGSNKLVRFNVLVLYLRAEVEATLLKHSKHDSITINAYNTVVSIGILKIAI
jgi:hypothetical protein